MDTIRGTVFVFLVAALCSLECDSEEAVQSSERILLKLIGECARKGDVELCLKAKAANALDGLLKVKEPLAVTDYLSLVRNPDVPENTHGEMEERSPDARSWKTGDTNDKLDEIIWNKLISLLTTRTIQISIPRDGFEGRAKSGKIFKKGHGIFLMAGMMGGMLMKMAMTKIAVVAGKALLIAKIALVLSLIIGLRKIVRHGGDGNAEVLYGSSESGGGWQRRYRNEGNWGEDASNLAYGAYYNSMDSRRP